MSQRPVVDIEFRGWSPYAKSRPANATPSSSAPAPTSVAKLKPTPTSNGSLRHSSSPVFVLANKQASTSATSQNGLHIGASGKGKWTPPKNSHTNDGIVAAQGCTAPHVADDAQYHANGLFTASLSHRTPACTKKRHQRGQDDVLPPPDEPRLRSIFDGEDQCVWSPSHRIAKTTEAATCQWIVSDEGWGDFERCEKVFTTTESLAKHVIFAHCKPTRPAAALDATPQQLPCSWGSCKYKRFTASILKEHVLEHLRPLAFACPFQECRMSISSHLNSAEALDAHIQTYHETNELLRPLGIPTPLKTLVAKKPLPRMPKRVPQWLANNEHFGVFREGKRKPVDDSSEPLAPGTIWPWDLVWTELNKIEPPAIPISPATLATLIPHQDPPTIRINEIPAAVVLPSTRHANQQMDIDMPARRASKTYIDLTNDDVELYPTPTSPRHRPVADLTAVSLAKRAAKRDHRNRLRNLAVDNGDESASSQSSYTSDGSQESDNEADAPQQQVKRIKLEGTQQQAQAHDTQMLPG